MAAVHPFWLLVHKGNVAAEESLIRGNGAGNEPGRALGQAPPRSIAIEHDRAACALLIKHDHRFARFELTVNRQHTGA